MFLENFSLLENKNVQAKNFACFSNKDKLIWLFVRKKEPNSFQIVGRKLETSTPSFPNRNIFGSPHG
jgi:hypothetical protein